eukprot:2879578-Pyramimonas_sp.AAC.1
MRDLRVGMRIWARQGPEPAQLRFECKSGPVALSERGVLGVLTPEKWQTADRLLLGSVLAHRHATEPPRRHTGATPARELRAPLQSGSTEEQPLSGLG